MFTTDINLIADYNKVIEELKRRIDDRQFFKGFFDKKNSVVYYYSNALPNPLKITYFPLIRIQINDQDKSSGGLKINLRIHTLFVATMEIIIALSWAGFLFMINYYGQRSIPGVIIPLVSSIALPLVLKNLFDRELIHFKSELRKIEEEIKDKN